MSSFPKCGSEQGEWNATIHGRVREWVDRVCVRACVCVCMSGWSGGGGWGGVNAYTYCVNTFINTSCSFIYLFICLFVYFRVKKDLNPWRNVRQGSDYTRTCCLRHRLRGTSGLHVRRPHNRDARRRRKQQPVALRHARARCPRQKAISETPEKFNRIFVSFCGGICLRVWFFFRFCFIIARDLVVCWGVCGLRFRFACSFVGGLKCAGNLTSGIWIYLWR